VSVPELIATIAGFLCLVLLVRQSIWNFPFAIVQVVLSGYVFYTQRLYSDVILQGFFVILNVYGWIHWSRPAYRESQLPVTRMSPAAMLGWSAATLAATAAWGAFAKFQLNAAAPFLDGFILVGSLTAQWLTARKKLESWWLWILVDFVAVPLYASRGLWFLSALFATFIVLCLLGLREWRQSIPPAPVPASV
jgi:nicotinamide mononucleotide transporter